MLSFVSALWCWLGNRIRSKRRWQRKCYSDTISADKTLKLMHIDEVAKQKSLMPDVVFWASLQTTSVVANSEQIKAGGTLSSFWYQSICTGFWYQKMASLTPPQVYHLLRILLLTLLSALNYWSFYRMTRIVQCSSTNQDFILGIMPKTGYIIAYPF